MLGAHSFKSTLVKQASLDSIKGKHAVVLLPKSRFETPTCGFTKWVKSQPGLFWEDFNKQKSGWLYNDSQRIFVQQHELKEDAKEEATRQALYKLGSAATQAVNAKKALEADFFISNNFSVLETSSYILGSTL